MANGICSVEDCDRGVYARCVCTKHYGRLLKYGDPLGSAPKLSAEERFFQYTDKDGPYSGAMGSSCWQWTGHKQRAGYGLFYGGRELGNTTAHRFAYIHFVGPIPAGDTVDHLCLNTSCVNPEHLEIVSLAENIRRSGPSGVSGVAAAKTHCPQRHEYKMHGVWVPNGYTKTRRPKRARRCTICDPYYATYDRAERIA